MILSCRALAKCCFSTAVCSHVVMVTCALLWKPACERPQLVLANNFEGTLMIRRHGLQTVHVSIRVEGPVHVIRFSDGDQDDTQGTAVGGDTQLQIQQTQAEMCRVEQQLKWYQDEKGILINILLDPEAEAAEEVKHRLNQRSKQPPPDRPAQSDAGDDSSVLHALEQAADDASGPIKGRRARRMSSQKSGILPQLLQLRRGSATSGSGKAPVQVQRSNASGSLVRLRSLRTARLLTIDDDDNSGTSGSSAGGKLSAQSRRASTGSNMRSCMPGQAASDQPVLSMPPAPGMTAATGSAASLGLDSLTARHGMAIETDHLSDASQECNIPPPNSWSLYNTAFEHTAPRADASLNSAPASHNTVPAAPAPPALALPHDSRSDAGSSAGARMRCAARPVGEAHGDSLESASSMRSADAPGIMEGLDGTTEWEPSNNPQSSALHMYADGNGYIEQPQHDQAAGRARNDKKVGFSPSPCRGSGVASAAAAADADVNGVSAVQQARADSEHDMSSHTWLRGNSLSVCAPSIPMPCRQMRRQCMPLGVCAYSA
jgi:hypothetical protein